MLFLTLYYIFNLYHVYDKIKGDWRIKPPYTSYVITSDYNTSNTCVSIQLNYVYVIILTY